MSVSDLPSAALEQGVGRAAHDEGFRGNLLHALEAGNPVQIQSVFEEAGLSVIPSDMELIDEAREHFIYLLRMFSHPDGGPT